MLNAIREDQIGQRQTLTKLAEAVGALVGGQGERASVLAEHGKVRYRLCQPGPGLEAIADALHVLPAEFTGARD
ncbi:hypothetical protein [Kitasatospora aureofaciens]|uniref:hypothetical protein n=1 Tax=Kitasatospora aureofaciens TaxID=1894 RepID=UPI0037CC69EF